jgi:hypothetical protein
MRRVSVMIEKYHKGIGNRTDLLIHIFKTVLSISSDCPIKFMARIKKTINIRFRKMRDGI